MINPNFSGGGERKGGGDLDGRGMMFFLTLSFFQSLQKESFFKLLTETL